MRARGDARRRRSSASRSRLQRRPPAPARRSTPSDASVFAIASRASCELSRPSATSRCQRGPQRRHRLLAVRRAVERERRRAHDLIAAARERGDVDRRPRRGRRASAAPRPPPRARCRRRLSPSVSSVARSLSMRRGARRIHAQLPDARAGELRQRGGAALRRGRGQRDERVRRAMPAARRCRVRADRSTVRSSAATASATRRRRRADRARAARRACRDRRRRASDDAHASGVAARAPAAQRLEPDDRRVVARAGGSTAAPRRRDAARGAAGRRAARIASRRTCASGSCAARARARASSTAAGGDQRLERQAPHARAGRRLAAAPASASRAQQRRPRRRRADASLRCSAHQRLEAFRDAEPIGDRLGARRHLEQRPLRRFDLRRGRVRQAADRFADRGADVRVVFDLQPRDRAR